jgi:hypothetical protein
MDSTKTTQPSRCPRRAKGRCRVIDRKDVAERLFALHGMGAGSLAGKLGTTVQTLDRLVCQPGNVRGFVYNRILPRLEDLERQVAAYKTDGAPAPPTWIERVIARLSAKQVRPLE